MTVNNYIIVWGMTLINEKNYKINTCN